MLTFLRRIINSRFGALIAMIGLVLIALAFALGDITGLRSTLSGQAARGDEIARVGDFVITPADLRQRIENDFQGFRQQQPTLTMAQFIAGGGLDGALERYLDNVALYQFGKRHGIVIGRAAIDGQIASLPQAQGLNGKFDPKQLERLLAAQRMTVDQFRGEVERVSVDRQIAGPTLGATQVPDGMALPYASLLLEQRAGTIGFVPTGAMPKGTPPSDQEIAGYFARNKARYAVPERRQVRYALASPDALKAAATPTDAQIAAAYQAKAAQYAARETRSVAQVVFSDKAAADALVAKVKGGTAIDVAAKAAGFEAAKLKDQDKAAYAAQAGADVANPVFSAARGAVVGPIKTPLGWLVAQVEAITQVPAKSLAQAKPELVKQLTDENVTKQMVDLRKRIDDALNNNATFDEIVGATKLSSVTTPPLFADGRDPAKPAAPADPKLAPVIQAGFGAEQGDAPQLVAIGNDGSFAIVAVDRVIAAAPPPLADVKARIIADIEAERGFAAAQKLAKAIVAKADGGTPLAAAFAGAGAKLPPLKPIGASRAQLAASRDRVPPPLALLFTLRAGATRMLPAPDGAGFYIIHLDKITPGDARGQASVVLAMRREIGQAVGGEYIAQLARAARKEVGVSTNAAAIAKLRGELTGAGDQP